MDELTIIEFIKEFLIPGIKFEFKVLKDRATELEDRVTELEKTVMYKPILKSKEENNERNN